MIVKSYIRTPLTLALIASLTLAVPAIAQSTRAAGQTYVYELTTTSDVHPDLSKIPASMRGAVQANVAAGSTPTVYVLTATTGEVAPDGSAKIHVQFTNSRLKNVPARFNQFDGMLTPAGQLVPNYDPNMPPPTGQMSDEQMRNSTAGQFALLFANFNDFAGGCGKRVRIKSGDAWRSGTSSQLSVAANYDFTVTAVAGSLATVTMKGGFSSTGGSNSVQGTGHYDMARRLVLDLHATQAFQNSAAGGSGTSTVDYKLRQ